MVPPERRHKLRRGPWRRSPEDRPGAARRRRRPSLKLLDVQSYGDKHWDLCFVFQVEIPGAGKLGQDFDKADYFDLAKLPPELRDDHREVLDMAKSRKVF